MSESWVVGRGSLGRESSGRDPVRRRPPRDRWIGGAPVLWRGGGERLPGGSRVPVLWRLGGERLELLH